VCPVCKSPHLIEVVYNVTVVRDLFIRNEDDWEIDDEVIEHAYDSRCSYTCRQCNHIYKGEYITDVIEKEMVEE
jgi:hypothetical protein